MSLISPDIIPMVSIRPGYICLYNSYENYSKKKKNQLKLMELMNRKEASWKENFKDNKTLGNISRNAERRISQAIDWLLVLAKDKIFFNHKFKKDYKFKINFITLTLCSPQRHTDNEIKNKLLNQFLIEAKKKWNLSNYVWRAESQKNGNIHFHIISDTFIPWNELRNVWNRIQQKLDYVSEFRKVNGNKVPNSTDIHSVSKLKNVSAYLAKYCTKNTDNRAIEGKLWGLSQSLSKLKSAKMEVSGTLQEEINFILSDVPEVVKHKDYVSVIYLKLEQWVGHGLAKMEQLFNKYVFECTGSNLINNVNGA